MATVPHVTSGLGLRKFQADGFLLTRVYHIIQHLILRGNTAVFIFDWLKILCSWKRCSQWSRPNWRPTGHRLYSSRIDWSFLSFPHGIADVLANSCGCSLWLGRCFLLGLGSAEYVGRSDRIDLACPYHTATPARPQRPAVGGSRSSKFKSPPLYTPKEGSFPFLFNHEFLLFPFFFLPSVSQAAKRSVKFKKDAVKSLTEICVDRQVNTHIWEMNKSEKWGNAGLCQPRGTINKPGHSALTGIKDGRRVNTKPTLEDLVISWFAKKFHEFYETLLFITAFTRAYQFSLSWLKWIQFMPSTPALVLKDLLTHCPSILLAAAASGSSKQAWHIQGVCTVLELLMMGGGTARNM